MVLRDADDPRHRCCFTRCSAAAIVSHVDLRRGKKYEGMRVCEGLQQVLHLRLLVCQAS